MGRGSGENRDPMTDRLRAHAGVDSQWVAYWVMLETGHVVWRGRR